VASSELYGDLIKESSSLCLLARLASESLVLQKIEATQSPTPPAEQSVHLVVQDGIEAFLPLKVRAPIFVFNIFWPSFASHHSHS
jgi:hypothetical protein